MAARRNEPKGTKSLPCLPCHTTAVAAVWIEGEGAGGVFATGSEAPPLASPAAVRWGEGGGGRSMSAMDLVAFGCGHLRPRGGYRCRGIAQLLRATLRPKTSGSDAGG